MSHVSIARFSGVLSLALVATVPSGVSAGPACEGQAGRRPALMRCRGSLSMGGHPPSRGAEGDLKLYFRGTRGEHPDSLLLGPGACTWADRAVRDDEPHIVVLPLNGPLAVDPYPIGLQGWACAADNGCTMEFCAYNAGGEWWAVDGFIRLAFGGS